MQQGRLPCTGRAHAAKACIVDRDDLHVSRPSVMCREDLHAARASVMRREDLQRLKRLQRDAFEQLVRQDERIDEALSDRDADPDPKPGRAASGRSAARLAGAVALGRAHVHFQVRHGCLVSSNNLTCSAAPQFAQCCGP